MPGNSQYELPNTDTYLNEQSLRVNAALPGAGAWDAAPVSRQCASFDTITLLFKYDAPANSAGGAFDFYLEFSRDNSVWYRTSIFSGGAVVGGADVMSRVQREFTRYAATSLLAEQFAFGPVEIDGFADYVRVVCRESGDIANPGTLEVLASWK